MAVDRFVGSISGLALGDAFGAPHEGGPLERAAWKVLGRRNGKRRWTDDTQMTIDVIESLVAHGRVDQDDLAGRFSRSYRWSRGYGPGAARILKRIRRGEPWASATRAVYREGSFGNGGAMRAAPIGLFFSRRGEDEVIAAADATAAVTHAHPLGREGAVLVALATALACQDASTAEIRERLTAYAQSPAFRDKLRTVTEWLRAARQIEPHTAAAALGNGIAAVDSCVTAVYVALAFRDRSFNGMLAYAIRLRGDVDTIASMAGAIWGAARGSSDLPAAKLDQLEAAERLSRLARALADAAPDRAARE